MSNSITTPQESYLINSPEVQKVIHDNVTKDMIWQPSSIVGQYDQGTIVWFSYDRYVKKNNNANNDTPPEDNTDDWMHISDYVAELFNMGFPDKMPELEQSLLILLSAIQNLTDNQNTLQEELNNFKLIRYKNFTNINWGNGETIPVAAKVYNGYLVIVGKDVKSALEGGKIRIKRQLASNYIDDITPQGSYAFENFGLRGAGVYKNMMFFYGDNGKLYKTTPTYFDFALQTTNQTENIVNHYIENDVLYLIVGDGSGNSGIIKTTDLVNFIKIKSGILSYRYGIKKFNGYIYFGGLNTGSSHLVRTNDNGNTFENKTIVPNGRVYAIEEFLGSLYFSCGNDGLYQMAQNGNIFAKISFKTGDSQLTDFLIKFKNFLIVGSEEGGIYRSLNGSTFIKCVIDTTFFGAQTSRIDGGFIFQNCLYLYDNSLKPILYFSQDGINFTILQHEFYISFFEEYYNNLYLGSSTNFGSSVGIIKKTLTL